MKAKKSESKPTMQIRIPKDLHTELKTFADKHGYFLESLTANAIRIGLPALVKQKEG